MLCAQELKAKTGLTVERRAGLCGPAESDLYRAKQTAEAANVAKSEFLSTLCHEIRNPVNVMVGIMDLALQTNLTQEQREYLTLMKISSGSLLSVINNTLDLEKIEAGFVDLEKIAFSLRDSTNETIKMLTYEAQRKGLRLALEVAPDVPDALRGDPMRLRQVLLNLISNAIKFTGQGEVVVRVTCQAVSGCEAICQFAICDTGLGIPLEKQAAIFAPFVQADPSVARQHGGSGLGLSISARLVKLMGGNIWLESSPGCGSTFSFTACFGLQKEHADAHQAMSQCGTAYPFSSEQLPAKVKPRAASGLSVLVVDDELINRRLAQLVLENEGCRVTLAENAETALDRLQRERFDVVLMDLKMPGTDGAQATREIRRRETSSDNHLLVFALTANETSHDYKYCLLSGMDGCLKKPIQPGSLFAMIRQLQAPPVDTRPPQILDERALMESVKGEGKLLAEIVDLFMVNAGKLMERARDAMAAENQSQFEHVMHTMKGMFQCLFAHAAARVAGDLQDLVAIDRRAMMFSQLEQEVTVLKAVLVRLKRKAIMNQNAGKGRAHLSILSNHRKRAGSLRLSGGYRHA